jgi:hypothetical protein
MSEDAEGEDDDAEGEGDEEYAQSGLSPAGVSGDGEFVSAIWVTEFGG